MNDDIGIMSPCPRRDNSAARQNRALASPHRDDRADAAGVLTEELLQLLLHHDVTRLKAAASANRTQCRIPPVFFASHKASDSFLPVNVAIYPDT